MNLKNCVYINLKIQILKIFQYKITYPNFYKKLLFDF